MADDRIKYSELKKNNAEMGKLTIDSGGIKNYFKSIGNAFTKGNAATKLSFLIMGFGCFANAQIARGFIFLAIEILYICFMVFFGSTYLAKFSTLGTELFIKEFDEATQVYKTIPGDNSMMILLYSVLTAFITLFFILLYFTNIRTAWTAEQHKILGEKQPTFKEDIKSLFDGRIHVTFLTLPAIGVLTFTVLPVVFMIFIAFTNFDRNHQPPGNLFTWTGLENFKDIFWQNPVKSHTFYSILVWTLVWAIFATFVNYFLGMILAMLINKKGIKFKSFWRFMFVVSIAVPGFVTLLLMRQLLQDQGSVNVLLQNLGLINSPIRFLSDPKIAKITVVVVNFWVGIPYTMLITSGILMNIPADLYESARIDGAGPVKQFTHITAPYMLFITTPYLITQFIGNFNNFNAIYFLTGGGPQSIDYYQAGSTDLLVTWLYKLTVNTQDYNLASVIGILVFIICAVIALATFNITAPAKKEDTFQ